MGKGIPFLITTVISMLQYFVDSQITTADGCYRQYVNTQLSCAFPFERRTGVTEQQCLQLCTDYASDCKSVQYRTSEQICDLFRSSANPGSNGAAQYGFSNNNNVNTGYSSSSVNTGVSTNQLSPYETNNSPAGFLRTSRPGADVVTYVRINRKKRHSQGQGGRRGPTGPRNRDSSEFSRRRFSGGGGYYRNVRPSYGGTGGSGTGGGSCSTPNAGPCPGVNYYIPTGSCSGGTTGGPVPNEATCPSGQEVRFLQIDGVSLRGNDEKTFSANSPQDCYDACAKNQLPTGEATPCRSVDYDLNTRTCALTLQVFPPAGTGVPDENANSVYYEKVCVDAAIAGNCPGPYLRAPQRILVGFAEQVLDVNSFSDCLNACIDSQNQFGFTCISGMYFFDEPVLNCVLNIESAQTQPDLFVPEDIDAVDYFETNCLGRNALRLRDRPSKNGHSSDTVLPLVGQSQGFGPWTPCHSKTKKQYRFRKCESMNPNKCLKQQRRCSKVEENIRRREREGQQRPQAVDDLDDGECPTGRCCAMLTTDGQKDCKRGVRILTKRGEILGRVPCRKPINC